MQKPDLKDICLEIKILNQKDFEHADLYSRNTSVIKIADLGKEFKLPIGPDGRLPCNMLLLGFNDVESNEPGAMARNDAVKIKEFLDKYLSTTNLLIVSCNGGTCRSPAVAAAILVYLGLDDMVIWRDGKFCPNMHVFNQTLSVLLPDSEHKIDRIAREKINLQAWKTYNSIY